MRRPHRRVDRGDHHDDGDLISRCNNNATSGEHGGWQRGGSQGGTGGDERGTNGGRLIVTQVSWAIHMVGCGTA